MLIDLIMAKSLLSLVLMTMQLISWGASPLYLCLGGDGSFCIDFGPESCKCCKHPHIETNGCGSAPSACQEHDHSHSEKPSVNCDKFAATAPCECTHIQIPEFHGTALVASSTSPDVERLVNFLTIASGLSFHVGIPPIDESTTLIHVPPPPTLSLTKSASAVMRC